LDLIASVVAALALVSFFSSYDVLPMTLSAPFGDLFAHARAQPGYSVTGSVAFSDHGHDITVDGVTFTARGHTSLRETECTFPKLKLDFPRESGLHSVKIGTHCGDSTGSAVTPRYGRLPNESSPHREAATYRLLEAMGVPSLKARPARITYVDTGASRSAKQSIERNAMLLEGTETAVKRQGGSAEIDVAQFTNAQDAFSVEDTVAVAFAEAMIGNFDWCLRMTPTDTYRCDAQHPLWNITAMRRDGGRARPLMHDFDVAGIVVGHHLWFGGVFTTKFAPSATEVSIEVLAQLERTRTLFSRTDLDAARRRFIDRKASAYRVLEAASVDAAGRAQMAQYLDSFFAIVGSDAAFYRPVVAVPETYAYADPQGASVVCASRGAVPIGTPVSEPLQKTDRLVLVRVLDALWRWAPPVKCASIHDGPVWIDADAISSNFPPR
jgi:hypothetical protein